MKTKMWDTKFKVPHNSGGSSDNSIYCIMIFERHRAVCFDKNYNERGTIQRRDAITMIIEAGLNDWISMVFYKYAYKVKIQFYPPIAEAIVFFDKNCKRNGKEILYELLEKEVIKHFRLIEFGLE
jgi:hypothetical protein